MMKKPSLTALIAAVSLTGTLGLSPVSAAFAEDGASTEFRTYDAATFFNTTDYSLAGATAFSPDGKSMLISSNETGVFNAYRLDLETGEQTALTTSDTNATFAVSYFPDGERILTSADGGGDELNHIFVRLADGTTTDLTPGDNVKASFVDWSDDGTSFIIQSNVRDSKFFDLYRIDAQTYNSTLMFENDLALENIVLSRDGRYVAGVKANTSADDDIFIVDLNGNEIVPNKITNNQTEIAHRVFSFTPDGSKLVYGTDEFGEFFQAHTYELATGQTAPLIVEDWDVSYVGYSKSGRYRVSGVNADASLVATITKLPKRGRRAKTLKTISLPDSLPAGDLRQIRFSPDEKTIAFALNASNAPSNIYTVDLRRKKATRHTQALPEQIEPAHLVSATVQRYESFDGTVIPGILYKPKQASADHPVPALVWVHGGPGGQSRVGYSAAIQHLVNHGYAVFAANNRGSIGYGKTFYHMDDKAHGESDLRDIVEAGNWLAEQDWVDGERVGVIGGSYGGYMTVAALAFHPDAFDVGIDIFGVTNWVRTLKSIPPWWESFRASLYDEMGDPATDEERLHRISPLFHAENITKPLLVVQGANDPRVLQVESDEMVEAVRKNGVPVEYLIFPDEGHGFLRRDNRIAASGAYVKFLDTYLKGKQVPAANDNAEAAAPVATEAAAPAAPRASHRSGSK